MENHAARVRASAILAYFSLDKMRKERDGRIADAAGKGVDYAKFIRTWAYAFLKNGSPSELRKAKHAKRKRFIHDVDCILPLQPYLYENKLEGELAALTEHTNTKISVGWGYDHSTKISERAMVRWLNALNINYREAQKGTYVDGHKSEDVLTYRNEFEEMEELTPWIPIIPPEAEDREGEIIWPSANVRPLLLVTHDESTFSANDGLKRLWPPDGEQSLRKKVQGRSIHVREFL